MPLPEKALIAQIRRMARAKGQTQADRGNGPTQVHPTRTAVLTGIGDDCAVLRLPPGHDTLVTTDFTLEGIHFRREWHSPESVGHRCLVRGLSDIAAMGGRPVAAFLSLALPRRLPQSWVERFARGVVTMAGKFGATLAGGDTAESPNGILADIIVVGSVPRGKAILRSGARVGDRIFVSGELGGSSAALAELYARQRPGKRKKPLDPRQYLRHFFPEPRVELGRLLREKGWATAMIDISDGLSTDLGHICDESGVGAELMADMIPRARVRRPAREVDLELALHGGEDYELLFTVPPGKRIPSRIAGIAIRQIGVITRGKRVFVGSEQVGYQLERRGWEHFRR